MNEISLTHADCLRTQTNWGETVTWNICSGTQSIVPWGEMDYLGAVGLIAFSFGICIFLIAIAVAFVRE